jgi:hypothetical protein
VRGTAQQPRLYVGMILILIFAEVLGKLVPQPSSSSRVILIISSHYRSLRLDCRSAHELPLKGRLLSNKRIVALGNWTLYIQRMGYGFKYFVFPACLSSTLPIHIKHVFTNAVSGPRKGCDAEKEKISAMINSFCL